jgi:hypothetical protein
MRCEHEHPERAGLPDHTFLGADPEPVGHRHHLPLLTQPRIERRAAPALCPLAAALGEFRACTGDGCVFFAVPTVPCPCAVEYWAPEARRDAALARWFLARRREAAGSPAGS